MKYGDKFTNGGMEGYLAAVNKEIEQRRQNIRSLEGVASVQADQLRQQNQEGLDSLVEWAAQIQSELTSAERTWKKIPD